ncbi:SusD/RagB family nutrient-binding outer membrane lipoprotein [Fulvitalea axinellae]
MKINKLLCIVLACLSVSSCRTWDEEFNINPNEPTFSEGTVIPPELFMGNMIEKALDRGAWNGMSTTILNVMTAVSRHTGKTRSLSQGNRHRSWHDLDGNIWHKAYNALADVKNMRRAAELSGDNRYLAIAYIWESYLSYTLTTLYGDIPYFILRDDSIIEVNRYDKQSDIYPAILERLASANELITADMDNVDAQKDFIFTGDIQKWKRFANSLRFRMALYMADADEATAKTIMNEIASNPSTHPVFGSNDDNCMLTYDGNQRFSTFYTSSSGLFREHAVSNILIERLLSLKDARIYSYAHPVKKFHTDANMYIVPSNPGPDKYVGHMYGITTGNSHAASWNIINDTEHAIDYSSYIGEHFRPMNNDFSPLPKASTSPLPLATYSELNFNMAEAALRGFISGDARMYYENGVKASLNEYDSQWEGDTRYDGAYLETGHANVDEYLAQQQVSWDGGRDHRLLVAEQKWIASFMLGFEPYIDHRRTMLPPLPASSGTLRYLSSGSGQYYPSRTAYPADEVGKNPEAYEAARAESFDIPITGDNNRNLAKMWLLSKQPADHLLCPIFKEPLKSDEEYPGQANFKTWYDNNWNKMFWWENGDELPKTLP